MAFAAIGQENILNVKTIEASGKTDYYYLDKDSYLIVK